MGPDGPTAQDTHAMARHFDDYEVLRLNEMPRVIEVYIVPSTNAPTGVGEPAEPLHLDRMAQLLLEAIEPAHAIAKVMELAPKRPKDHLMVVNLSGRGDKDVPQVGDILKGKKK